ncbi:alpha/beta hydrolase [Mesorhizobium sp. B2-1-3A]|uniref:alpha/beta fold hydrolase n=1 Tax=Mesorhizobium sp. B2-1-3A TaxID=2589971 RepID=UPI001FEF85B1|nr:alpha/beta hydrolase [Mesorhizobium sp. B2-1-3A]
MAEARDRGGKLWSAREQADLFHEAAASLGIHRYLVLGHSWGAWVALEMARRHRSVAGLILVSGYYSAAEAGSGSCGAASPAVARHGIPSHRAAGRREARLAIGDANHIPARTNLRSFLGEHERGRQPPVAAALGQRGGGPDARRGAIG